ncbi:MAG: hypothetical protein OCD02_11300 [Spirochaetaceae bacterium]
MFESPIFYPLIMVSQFIIAYLITKKLFKRWIIKNHDIYTVFNIKLSSIGMKSRDRSVRSLLFALKIMFFGSSYGAVQGMAGIIMKLIIKNTAIPMRTIIVNLLLSIVFCFATYAIYFRIIKKNAKV